MQSVSRPIFPGYLFIQIPPDRREWRQINSTLGIAQLVSLDRQKPTRVPADLMKHLFAQCDGEIWHADVDGIQPGQSARIVQGPFSQLVATVDSAPEHDRVFVLLDIMGRATRVTVSVDDLDPL